MSVLQTLALLVIGATCILAQRRLALPDPRSCANRKCFYIIYWVIFSLITTTIQINSLKPQNTPSFETTIEVLKSIERQ